MTNKTYIGVDIGGTSIVAALVVNGNIEKTHQVETKAKESLEIILKQLFSAIDAVLNADVQAIGIGCPGFMDAKTGGIIAINNIPAFQGINLKNHVVDKYKLPVFINNDANCFVLGETYFGAGKGFNHVLGITLGTGLGGGVIIDRKVFGGLFGAAGEIGCIPFKDGIVEDYTSSHYFANKFNSTGAELFQKAETGDEVAKNAFKEVGNNIGHLINTVMYVIAPEMIIIGGSIAKSFKYIEPGIKESLNDFLFEIVREKVVIKPAELENAGLVGAAALCASELE